jgi:phospholipid transport system transporter-binding protein
MVAPSSSLPAQPFVSVSPGQYRLEAPLTFATVAALRAPGLAVIQSSAHGLILDLQAVPAVDSAGLALLIDWLAEARLRSRTLKYSQPPPTLVSLARLSDVEKLITP